LDIFTKDVRVAFKAVFIVAVKVGQPVARVAVIIIGVLAANGAALAHDPRIV
jgi:hypothetical protein